MMYFAFFAAAIALALVVAFSYQKFFKKKSTAIESQALFNTEKNFAHKLKNLFANADSNPELLIAHLEEILLTADVGIAATESLIRELFESHKPKTNAECLTLLQEILKKRLTPRTDFFVDSTQKPFVIYLVGVNGVGKTTTIGKLAHQFKEQGHKVMLVAADTFRAAAVEQLRVWSQKNDVAFSGGHDGMDPSAAIVDGLQAAVAQKMDVVLVDTAGRLHTKSNLMEELKKMVRMSEKVLQKKPNEIWLVVDAITGQNGFQQAKVFCDAIALTGLILTKYDATSKGGVILSIVEQTSLPVRFVGLGERIQDLQPFNSHRFVEKIFSNP